MKKTLLATTALVAAAVAVPAGAADMRPAFKAPPPIVRPACAQFGGFYVGANVGWAHYDYSWNDQNGWANGQLEEDAIGLAPDAIHTTKFGWAAGIGGGFNWQTGCTVWGVEIDYMWADAKAEKAHLVGSETRDELFAVRSKLNGIGFLRTRLGVVVDNVLLYVTGGFAVARFDRDWFHLELDENDPPEGFSSNKTRWGGVVGVGAEWAWTPNVSLKTEFLYAKFDRTKNDFIDNRFDACESVACRFEHNDSVLIGRVGLNFRFGGFGIGKGPVAARF
jgi:outer membrane immunogenic protein